MKAVLLVASCIVAVPFVAGGSPYPGAVYPVTSMDVVFDTYLVDDQISLIGPAVMLTVNSYVQTENGPVDVSAGSRLPASRLFYLGDGADANGTVAGSPFSASVMRYLPAITSLASPLRLRFLRVQGSPSPITVTGTGDTLDAGLINTNTGQA